MALRELLAVFDVDTGLANTKLRELDAGITKMTGTLGALADAFIGSKLVGGLKSFIDGQIALGAKIKDTSDKLGVSFDELQRWEFAAAGVGVSADAAASSLQTLNKNIGDALDGGKGATEIFRKLGVAMKDGQGPREIGALLPEIADSFARMGSDAERTTMAVQIFGKAGASLIPILKNGSGGLAEADKLFRKLGGGMSGDFVKAAKAADDEIFALKFGLANLKSSISFAVLPVVTRAAAKMQDWVGELIKLTRETTFAKTAWILFGAASGAASLKAAGGFAKLLGIVPKNAGFWKTALGLGQFGFLLMLVAGLALIFEDLWVGIKGGESAIRKWLDSAIGVEETNKFFAALKATVDEIQKAFSDLGPALKPILTDLMKMAVEAGPGIAKAFVWVVKVIAGAVRLLAGFGEVVAKTVGAVAKFVGGDNSGIDSLGKDLGSTIDRAGDAVFGRGGLFDMSPSNNVADYGVPLQNIAGGGPVSVPRSGGASRAPTQVTQTNRIDVTVEGGSTPQETGRAVANGVKWGLGDTLEDTRAALDTGG